MKLDDLKNIDLKNLNMQDIKEKILLLADKKTLIKIGVSSVIIRGVIWP